MKALSQYNKKSVLMIGGGIVLILLIGIFVSNSQIFDSKDKEVSDKNQMSSLDEIRSQDPVFRLPESQIISSMQSVLPDPDPLKLVVNENMTKDLLKTDDFDIQGIFENLNPENTSRVNVSARYRQGKYELIAELQNIPAPKEGYVYEGWVVRQNPFEFVSTGKIDTVGGVYVNSYVSERDLLPYNFYLVTLESQNGEITPEESVIGGYMGIIQ